MSLTPNQGHDHLVETFGNDTINRRQSAGNDSIAEGESNDVLIGINANTSVSGRDEDESDTLTGGKSRLDSSPIDSLEDTAVFLEKPSTEPEVNGANIGNNASQPSTLFSFDNFSDTSNLTFTGSAQKATSFDGQSSVIRLTDSGGQNGSAFLTSPISLSNDASFSTFFQFQITDHGGWTDNDGFVGADGIVFVIQTQANNVGGAGYGIGYGGILNSLGIEFDTWENGGVDWYSGNHVGIDLNGDINSVQRQDVQTPLNNGNIWNSWVDYNGATNLLEVRLSQSEVRPEAALLSYEVDLPSVLGKTDAFIGFTSGTGNAWGDHDILSWKFNDVYNPIAPGFLEFSAANFSVNEDGTPVTSITVNRKEGSSGDVSASVLLTNGTAAEPDDYDNSVPIVVSFADGQTTQTVTIPIVNDILVEGNETINLNLSNPTGGAKIGTQNAAVLNIVDNDFKPITPGVITFSAANFSVNEDGTPVTSITVNRTEGSSGDVSATVLLTNGTAAAPDDYDNSVPIVVSFADGETTKTVTIPLVDDDLVEGNETINLKLSNPTGGATLGTQDEAVLNIVDNDVDNPIAPGFLAFSATNFSVNENGTPVTSITVNRTEGSSGAVSATVLLTNGTAAAPDDYNIAPIVVSFADGETTKTVTIPIFNDSLVEGNETINLKLSNPTGGATIGTQNAAVLNIVDNDFKPTLTLAIAPDRINEAAVTSATVTRNGDTAAPLSVTLTSSDFNQITVPNEVTIPAGETSTTFEVKAIDDTLIERSQSYSVIATTPGFVSASDGITVTDNDRPNLSVSLDSDRISEGAANPATIGTVTRDTVTEQDLVVLLASSDSSEARLPKQVIIPANQQSATFEVNAVNDTLADGTQRLTLTATPTYSSTNAAVDQGAGNATIQVTDDESPTLSVSINKAVIAESAGNNAATGTVTRNAATDRELTVTLLSNDTSEATVPANITIPAYQESATFPINAVNDGIEDGIQTTRITALAPNFGDGSKTIDVTDINVPDITISNLVAPTEGLTNTNANFTYRVENQGLNAAAGPWVERVYLSTDDELGNDIQLGEYAFNATLPAGQFYEKTLPFSLPKTAGQYWLIATTDATNTINEGTGTGERNNTKITPITVNPAYRAVVSTDTETGVAGTPVIFNGQALSNANNSPLPFEFVTVGVQLDGKRREINAFTDKDGNFTTTFRPLPGEAGVYQVSAYFPGNPGEDTTAEDQFKLLGMRLNSTSVSHKMFANSPLTNQVELQNLTNIPLTGITASVEDAPANWNIQVNAPQYLSENATNDISYTITAPDESVLADDFKIKLTSAEGATATLPIKANIQQILPKLVSDKSIIQSGMLRGSQTPVEFKLTNEGGVPTGEIQVELPDAPWLSLASSPVIPSLAAGESTNVTLLLTPDANLDLTSYTGNIDLDAPGNDADLSLPFNFKAVSEAVGELKVNVVDELFYFGEGKPKLANATVTLRDPFTGNEVATAVTDVTGTVSFPNIQEGYYNLEVRAKNHDSYRNNVLIQAGQTNTVESFLSRQTVKYIWTVEETEIEDRTNITIESVFETDVPIPTVTIDPPSIDVADLDVVGEVMQVNMTVTNHGLIAADNVKLNFGDHPFYKIEPLIKDIGPLAAKSSLTIPVTVTRIDDFDTLRNDHSKLTASTNEEPSVPCSMSADLEWTYKCAGYDIKRTVPLPVLNIEGNCPGGSSGGLPPTGGGGDFGTANVYGVPIYISPSPTDCDPCVQKTLQAIVKCGIEFIPLPAPISAIKDTEDALDGLGDGVGGGGGVSGEDVYKVAKAGLSLMEKLSGPLGKTLTAGECTKDILTACDDLEASGSGGGGTNNNLQRAADNHSTTQSSQIASHSHLPELEILQEPHSTTQSSQIASHSHLPELEILHEPLNRLQKVIDSQVILFGDRVWLEGINDQFNNWVKGFIAKIELPTEEGAKVSLAERNELLNLTLPSKVTGSDFNKFIDRWNRSIDYWNAGIFNLSDVPQNQSTDFLALDSWRNIIKDAQAGIEESQANGYSDITGEIKHSIEELETSLKSDGSGVCAHVRIRIDQEAVMTRSAFVGTLEIDNENDAALTDISVTLDIRDNNGNKVNDIFGAPPPVLEGLSAIDGTGSINPESIGSAEFTMIPTSGAAPDEPTVYTIGGTLSYTEEGKRVTVPLAATPITVLPQAELHLDYFQQRDVIGDDPFTNDVETSVPFSLGVIVKNEGKGAANNLQITSGQPKIIENERGLLVNFDIIGTSVGGESVTPSLNANLGNIEAGKTAVADWLLKSSVQGKFVEYKATFEHLNDLGNSELSLIKSVEIHELIRKVQAQSPTDDQLPDFLVNDNIDAQHLPDTLYLSDGTTAPVSVVTNATVDAPPSDNDLQVEVNATMPAGWGYLRIADPANGQYQIQQVLRSDGSSVPLENVWTSDRTFPANGGPILENVFHLLDYNSTGSYTIVYGTGDATNLQVTDVVDVTPDPRTLSVSTIDVEFSKAINSGSFDYTDLVLTRNGSNVAIAPAGVTVTQVSDKTYRLSGLTEETTVDGEYELTVNANGIQDAAGKAGVGSASDTWVKKSINPGTLAFNDTEYSINENGTPIAAVTVNRTDGSDGAVGVPLTLSDLTAKAPDDYNSTPIVVNFAHGETSKTVTIPVVNDTELESSETIKLTLGNPTGGAAIGDPDTAVVAIADDEVQLAFGNTEFSVNEDGTPVAAVTVTRTGTSKGSVGATVTLTNGTASAADYNNAPIVVSLADGNMSQNVQIPIIDDTLAESRETINLALGNPTGGATIKAQNTAVLTIVDNDPVNLIGTPSNDELVGTDFNDTIDGKGEYDYIDGLNGNDILEGGTGNNDLIYGSNGNDTISDIDGVRLAQGGEGNDNIDITFGRGWDNNSNATDAPRSLDLISGGNGDDNITITMNHSRFSISLHGDELIETPDSTEVIRAGGNDVITLERNYANSVVDLGRGNDRFNGGSGADNISGRDGNDIIATGNGSDRLSGDVGEDTLTGGAGNDRFVLAPTRDSSTSVLSRTSFDSTPTDIITDFTDGQDLIELTGGLSFQQLNIVSIASSPNGSRLDSTLIMLASTKESLAILTGVRPSQITATDFISNSI
jgi:Ca2+-binding RTX toxin-like protein